MDVVDAADDTAQSTKKCSYPAAATGPAYARINGGRCKIKRDANGLIGSVVNDARTLTAAEPARPRLEDARPKDAVFQCGHAQ